MPAPSTLPVASDTLFLSDVKFIISGTYCTYDFNGNQITRNGQTVTWTSYNYPSHVPNGTKYHDYFYAADRQRWKQVYYNGTSSETTIFVGGILEKHTANGVTEYWHTIQAGEQPVALYTRPSSGTITTQYFLLDHLGSVAEITNSAGARDVAENFAAYGEQRDPSDWSGPPSAADTTVIAGITQRAYTFHTNPEESSLIHMNGRIADSLTGRFLSADPYVFQPMLTQSFNRYSYVRNNLLSMTDPSGFAGICADLFSCTGSIVGSALGYMGSKLFGRKKPPPPKGCFTNVVGTGCYGKAAATKLYDIARDIYGLPPLQSPSIWGVGGHSGTGACGGWGAGCMSFEDFGGTVSEELGDQLSYGNLIPTFIRHLLGQGKPHVYGQETFICSMEISGCTLDNVFLEVLRCPAPAVCGMIPVSTEKRTDILEFGTVTHEVDW